MNYPTLTYTQEDHLFSHLLLTLVQGTTQATSELERRAWTEEIKALCLVWEDNDLSMVWDACLAHIVHYDNKYYDVSPASWAEYATMVWVNAIMLDAMQQWFIEQGITQEVVA